MDSLDWQEILKCIEKSTTSQKARLAIQKISPYSDHKKALTQQKRIFLAHHILVQSQQRPYLESLDFFDSWFSRVKKGSVLQPMELKDIRSFALELLALKLVLESFQKKNHQNQNSASASASASASETYDPFDSQQLLDVESVISSIDQLISPQGEIRSDASETLYKLFREKDFLSKQIQSTMNKLVHDFEIQEYLQDRFVTTREGRWVIPVKSGRQYALKGMVHGTSQTKQTVYLEPEKIIPLNNRLRDVLTEIDEEIQRLLQEISQYLHLLAPELEVAEKVMLSCDILFALAHFSRQIEAGEISFTTDSLSLENLRHPLMVYQQKNPISNSLNLDQKRRILLLSGPNAGGKTVLMKALGLACHMARCGLPVCATQGQIPFFKTILVSIGDSQAVDEELSTFAAHLKRLNEASELHGPENLVLIDEIAASTDPEEGSALAKAFIEEFSHRHIFAVITSHLNQLKSGWSKEGSVLPGSLEFDLKKGLPTYHFLPGITGQSLALAMAKRSQVKPSILDRAYELLSPESRQRLATLSETEALKESLLQLQEDLKKSRKAMALWWNW
jgi:DNA mismatch repair protein MutS2